MSNSTTSLVILLAVLSAFAIFLSGCISDLDPVLIPIITVKPTPIVIPATITTECLNATKAEANFWFCQGAFTAGATGCFVYGNGTAMVKNTATPINFPYEKTN